MGVRAGSRFFALRDRGRSDSAVSRLHDKRLAFAGSRHRPTSFLALFFLVFSASTMLAPRAHAQLGTGKTIAKGPVRQH